MNNERRIKRIENVLLGTGVVREPDYRHATATDVEDEMIYVKDLDERIATTIKRKTLSAVVLPTIKRRTLRPMVLPGLSGATDDDDN